MHTTFLKSITILALLLGFSSFSFSAENYDTKAFRTVTKLCSSCHGTAFYMAKQIDDDDWEFYFNTKGKLKQLHKNNAKGLASLNNKRFLKHKKRILKFFIKNSKFSGAVNGCDANFCGTNH